jgi:hypothetical protein
MWHQTHHADPAITFDDRTVYPHSTFVLGQARAQIIPVGDDWVVVISLEYGVDYKPARADQITPEFAQAVQRARDRNIAVEVNHADG